MFFDVSIDYLVDDVPLSLWQYASPSSDQAVPCVGREWELSQLQQLHNLEHSGQKVVCIHGMQGIGKTSLIHHFLAQKVSSGLAVYAEADPSTNFLARVCRVLLVIPESFDEIQIRDYVKPITNSSLLYFYFLRLLDIPLNPAEEHALSEIRLSRLREIEVLAVTLLIQKTIENDISLVALDGLHEANSEQLRFIETFVEQSKAQSLFLIFGFTDVGAFSFIPDWLEQSHSILLTSLNDEACESLAQVFMGSQQICPSKYDAHRRISIQRANGHPAILKALIESNKPNEGYPEMLYKTTIKKLFALPSPQLLLLKFIASTGAGAKIESIDSFISGSSIKGVVSLHELVRKGLLRPKSNSYTFPHVLIREIVQSQVNEKERRALLMFVKPSAKNSESELRIQ